MKRAFGLELSQACENFPLDDWLQSNGFEQHGDEWTANCPHCGKEQKVVCNAKKRVWHCWVCQKLEVRVGRDNIARRKIVHGGGGLVKLITWMTGVRTREAVELILRLSIPGAVDLHELPDLSLVVDIVEANADDFDAMPFPEGATPIPGNLPYLESRGISAADVADFGLFWCSHGRYRDRVVFPVWERGRFLYFQARALWDGPRFPGEKFLKAMNPPRADGANYAVSSDVLFNLDNAARCPRVAVTEGPVDAIKVGLDAVCTFGKQISLVQLRKLVRAGVRAIDLMWDGPSEREPQGAWPEMDRAAPLLSLFFDLRLVRLPAFDPGRYDRGQNAWYRMHRAEPVENTAFIARI